MVRWKMKAKVIMISSAKDLKRVTTKSLAMPKEMGYTQGKLLLVE